MDFGKLYSEASGRAAVFQKSIDGINLQEEKQRGETLKQKITLEWMQHPATQEMIRDLSDKCNELVKGAIQLALTYPQHNNHQQIIQNLVRANQIQQQLDSYVHSYPNS